MVNQSPRGPTNAPLYIFTRLHQMGVRAVHGVPGDYNLETLDCLKKAGLLWVGNINELNAGALAQPHPKRLVDVDVLSNASNLSVRRRWICKGQGHLGACDHLWGRRAVGNQRSRGSMCRARSYRPHCRLSVEICPEGAEITTPHLRKWRLRHFL